MPDWRLLLLGGTTASGKSTSARKAARKLGIGCVAVDSLWQALLRMTTPESHPVLHRWPRPDDPPGEAEELAKLHVEEAEILTPAIEIFIDRELSIERSRLIVQGAWITPALAARRCALSNEVRAAFIDEPDESALMEAVLARSGRSEPTHRQTVMVEVARLYGDWLRAEAQRHALPLVAARPHETLADRIIEAAGCGDQSNRSSGPQCSPEPGESRSRRA